MAEGGVQAFEDVSHPSLNLQEWISPSEVTFHAAQVGAISPTSTINCLQIITVNAVEPGRVGDNLEAECSGEAETCSAFWMRQM